MSSESNWKLDNAIMVLFEEDNQFYFPLRSQRDARAFVKALVIKGFPISDLRDEVGEPEQSFAAWRKGLGRSGVGNSVMERINRPFQQILQGDGDSSSVECRKENLYPTIQILEQNQNGSAEHFAQSPKSPKPNLPEKPRRLSAQNIMPGATSNNNEISEKDVKECAIEKQIAAGKKESERPHRNEELSTEENEKTFNMKDRVHLFENNSPNNRKNSKDDQKSLHKTDIIETGTESIRLKDRMNLLQQQSPGQHQNKEEGVKLSCLEEQCRESDVGLSTKNRVHMFEQLSGKKTSPSPRESPQKTKVGSKQTESAKIKEEIVKQFEPADDAQQRTGNEENAYGCESKEEKLVTKNNLEEKLEDASKSNGSANRETITCEINPSSENIESMFRKEKLDTNDKHDKIDECINEVDLQNDNHVNATKDEDILDGELAIFVQHVIVDAVHSIQSEQKERCNDNEFTSEKILINNVAELTKRADPGIANTTESTKEALVEVVNDSEQIAQETLRVVEQETFDNSANVESSEIVMLDEKKELIQLSEKGELIEQVILMHVDNKDLTPNEVSAQAAEEVSLFKDTAKQRQLVDVEKLTDEQIPVELNDKTHANDCKVKAERPSVIETGILVKHTQIGSPLSVNEFDSASESGGDFERRHSEDHFETTETSEDETVHGERVKKYRKKKRKSVSWAEPEVASVVKVESEPQEMTEDELARELGIPKGNAPIANIGELDNDIDLMDEDFDDDCGSFVVIPTNSASNCDIKADLSSSDDKNSTNENHSEKQYNEKADLTSVPVMATGDIEFMDDSDDDGPASPADDGDAWVTENYDSDEDASSKFKAQAKADATFYHTHQPHTDGPGFIYIFADIRPGSEFQNIKVGASQFPRRRLVQGRHFNMWLTMVKSIPVTRRKLALQHVIDKIEGFAVEGSAGWYEGSMNDLVSRVTKTALKYST